ncbi:isocitrate/isopropylmalate dehydrogenase family protein [Candidatus Cyanaurora vandensis]|uniref:isocitrate/isopropylmalate dehydrogenase family protein n=1 Tax=Candidatus Cyanaurora vandensis TaxID=2714958 RepID=UPI0025804285|nr:isocitrate/isopropylmalate dehydrogenase family protein [Candidatus Cyanaurora vandensis]
MAYAVTLIPGDGIGPELTRAMVTVLEATGLQFDWDQQEAGIDALTNFGTPLPEATLASVRRTGVGIKGPTTTPVGIGFRSVNVALRLSLDLYANLRPARTMTGVKSRFENIDLVVVRENTEDLYCGIEFERGQPETLTVIEALNRASGKQISPTAGISIKPFTPAACERIVRFAFEYSRKNNRKKVTAVHKANIMKFTDGLYLEVARQVALDYPDIAFEDRIVDNMCMQLVQKPELYDVLVLPNLYGDIISDLTAGLIGGLGVAPGANLGDNCALFEAIHGSAPKYAGQDKVNPTALILTGALMLRHLGETEAAERVETAVAEVIREGKAVTYDLARGQSVGTQAMAQAIAQRVQG